MVELLRLACGRTPSRQEGNGDDEDSDNSSEKQGTPLPLSEWDREGWNQLSEDIDAVYELLRRKDAAVLFLSAADAEQFENATPIDAKDDAEEEEENRKNKDDEFATNVLTLLPKKLQTVMGMVQIHAALAPIWHLLDEYATKDRTATSSKSDKNLVHETG